MSNNQNHASGISESRRNIILGATAVAATAGLGFTAEAEASMDHKHIHHAIPEKRQKVINASLQCVKDGQACAQHCIEMFKMKDTSMANCSDNVHQMLATCTAMSQLASFNSKHLKDFAKVCIKVCEDCKDACDEHADKHVECKACSDSCKDCIKACENYIA